MARSENQKLKLFYLRELLLKKTDAGHSITVPELIEALNAAGIKAERKSVYTDRI